MISKKARSRTVSRLAALAVAARLFQAPAALAAPAQEDDNQVRSETGFASPLLREFSKLRKIGRLFKRRPDEWPQKAPNRRLADGIKGDDRREVLGALASGADVNAVDAEPSSPVYTRERPLGLALMDKNARLTLLLLEQPKIDVNFRTDFMGATPLMWAIRLGDLELMAEILARGADVDARNTFAQTALMMAVEGAGMAEPARLSAVRLLLAHGADPQARDFAGHGVFDGFYLARGLKLSRADRTVSRALEAAGGPGAGARVAPPGRPSPGPRRLGAPALDRP